MNAPRDPAEQAELDYATLRFQTAPTPLERRAWWNVLCQLQDERDVGRDLARGPGSTDSGTARG